MIKKRILHYKCEEALCKKRHPDTTYSIEDL